jgi:hypothetical protein
MPSRGGVGEEHRDLADLDLPGGAGVLPLNPRGGGALLQVTGLTGHQHCTRIAQPLHYELPQVIADSAGVPARCGQ